MFGFIALPAAALVIFIALVIVRKRRRESWHNLNNLSPVSGQWLADRRRSG